MAAFMRMSLCWRGGYVPAVDQNSGASSGQVFRGVLPNPVRRARHEHRSAFPW